MIGCHQWLQSSLFCLVLHNCLSWNLKLLLGPVIFLLCLFCLSVAHRSFFVTADSTGTYSLYTTYKDYELMFHVSTLLPYTPNNRQQVSCLIFNISPIKQLHKGKQNFYSFCTSQGVNGSGSGWVYA